MVSAHTHAAEEACKANFELKQAARLEANTAAAKADEAPQPKPIKPIPARDWQTEPGMFQNRHLVVIPQEIYPQVLTDCRYFVNCENKIVAFDRVEFRAKENTFIADCIVSQCVQGSFIQMVEVAKTILSTTPTEEPQASGEWAVAFLGGNRSWCVIRPDGGVARSGFTAKANAEQEMFTRKKGSPINSMSGR